MPHYVARYTHADESIGIRTETLTATDFPDAAQNAIEQTPEGMKLYELEELPEYTRRRHQPWYRTDNKTDHRPRTPEER
jgi:hypothetical protein